MQIDHDEIMRRAAAISPTLSAHARECDAARKLTAESMAAVVDAGMFRIPQPRRVRGYELSLRTLADAVTCLSEACPSSGWVLMVMGAHHWCLGSFPEAAQDEIFGDGRDGLVAGTLSSQGTASVVDGGFRVEGRWQFCSGVDHAHWVILGCADAATHRPSVHVVVPRADLEVDDTWHVMGLQGTGSKDVVAHNIFVPAHRAIDTRILFRGASPHAANHATNLYRLSAEAMLSVSVSTAVLGSAKFALASIHRAHQRAARRSDRRAKGRTWADASAIGGGRRRDSFGGSADSRHTGRIRSPDGDRRDLRQRSSRAREVAGRVCRRAMPPRSREDVLRIGSARRLCAERASGRISERQCRRAARQYRLRQLRRTLRPRAARLELVIYREILPGGSEAIGNRDPAPSDTLDSPSAARLRR